MRFTTIELAHTAYRPADFPVPDLPVAALLGRSNSGKSTLLNALLGEARAARTGQRPGLTRGVRFYRADGRILLADTPGYGYAGMGKETAEANGRILEAFLTEFPMTLALLLIDVRREPRQDERIIMERLALRSVPVCIVLTKCDKVKARDIRAKIESLHRTFPPTTAIHPVSAESGHGMKDLMKFILQGAPHALRQAEEEPAV
jgi:GTP-binding protein